MAQLPLNGLDLAVAIVLIISALLACMRGFVQETLSIGAWVGASFGSLYALPYVQPTARRLIPLDWAADTAAVIVLFLAILFMLSLVINMLAGKVKRSGFNPLDPDHLRLAGEPRQTPGLDAHGADPAGDGSRRRGLEKPVAALLPARRGYC
jgi:hypothetical protein